MDMETEKQICRPCQSILDDKLELTRNLDLFGRFSGLYDIEKIYLSYFLELPNSLLFHPVNGEGFLAKFYEEFGDDILKEISDIAFFENKRQLNNHYLILREQILVHVEQKQVKLLNTNPDGEIFQSIQNLISQFQTIKKKKPEICVIISNAGYLTTKKIKFKKPEIDFQDNYGDDFLPVHDKAMNLLKKVKDSGLFLFHGKPGTGKSTYLRYLIKSINKKTIFISPKMAGNLDSIEITKLLLENKNCILVIEDAEGLVVSRNHEHNSNLSTILNLTDGILGESLGIQIIATFNTNLKNIDSALMRKGRLKLAYEFTELPAEKASKIISKQGVEVVINHPMTLAEAYNYDASSLAPAPSQKSM